MVDEDAGSGGGLYGGAEAAETADAVIVHAQHQVGAGDEALHAAAEAAPGHHRSRAGDDAQIVGRLIGGDDPRILAHGAQQRAHGQRGAQRIAVRRHVAGEHDAPRALEESAQRLDVCGVEFYVHDCA